MRTRCARSSLEVRVRSAKRSLTQLALKSVGRKTSSVPVSLSIPPTWIGLIHWLSAGGPGPCAGPADVGPIGGKDRFAIFHEIACSARRCPMSRVILLGLTSRDADRGRLQAIHRQGWATIGRRRFSGIGVIRRSPRTWPSFKSRAVPCRLRASSVGSFADAACRKGDNSQKHEALVGLGRASPQRPVQVDGHAPR